MFVWGSHNSMAKRGSKVQQQIIGWTGRENITVYVCFLASGTYVPRFTLTGDWSSVTQKVDRLEHGLEYQLLGGWCKLHLLTGLNFCSFVTPRASSCTYTRWTWFPFNLQFAYSSKGEWHPLNKTTSSCMLLTFYTHLIWHSLNHSNWVE